MNIQPTTLGQKIDVDLESVKNRLTALEAKAEADAKSVEAWFKANWPHFVTWGGAAWLVVKHAL